MKVSSVIFGLNKIMHGLKTMDRDEDIGEFENCLNLKSCSRPDCEKYFVGHGSQLYCPGECANWAQKKSKRKYWHKRFGEGQRSAIK